MLLEEARRLLEKAGLTATQNRERDTVNLLAVARYLIEAGQIKVNSSDATIKFSLVDEPEERLRTLRVEVPNPGTVSQFFIVRMDGSDRIYLNGKELH